MRQVGAVVSRQVELIRPAMEKEKAQKRKEKQRDGKKTVVKGTDSDGFIRI